VNENYKTRPFVHPNAPDNMRGMHGLNLFYSRSIFSPGRTRERTLCCYAGVSKHNGGIPSSQSMQSRACNVVTQRQLLRRSGVTKLESARNRYEAIDYKPLRYGGTVLAKAFSSV
jgi:hypothetical protein